MRVQYSEYNKKFTCMRLLILPSIRHVEQDEKLNDHSSGRNNGEEMDLNRSIFYQLRQELNKASESRFSERPVLH